MEEEFIIPIDDAIESFRHHLDAHDRTILSARFGDGKSFFLSHFMEDEDVAERYTFLTIYPVNYQVVENRDIFEVIKRDILLQMLLKGVIETDIDISDAEALALYLQCQPHSFLEGFIPLITELSPSEEATKTVACTIAIKKVFKTIKQKLDSIRQQSDVNQIEKFFDEVENNPIVGRDAISGIIQRGIKQYKDKNPNKRVVLVIEDMDRIDPAHLFRILNVFSAHIDYSYRWGIKPDDTLIGNKFGLDKVIFVLHLENLKKIFHHFYGAGTNFEGYIEKFCSSNHYTYSLSEQLYNLLIKHITKEIGLDTSILNVIIKPNDLTDCSVRNAIHAIERTGEFVIDIVTATNRDGQVEPLHQGILRLIAILRKLGLTDSDIISRLKGAILQKKASQTSLFIYLAPYLNLIKYNDVLGDIRYANNMESTNTVCVESIENGGRGFCTFIQSMDSDDRAEDYLTKLLERLLKMVAK